MPTDINKAAAALAEIGATGLKRQNGQVFEEFLPQLRGDKANKVYAEMSENDAIAKASVRGLTLLCLESEWTTEPGSEDDEGVERAEFADSLRDDMSQPWSTVVEDALTEVVFGHSFAEVVYKYRVGPDQTDASRRSKYSDGRIGWRKFAPRSQESLCKWEFDEGDGIQGVWQLASGSWARVFIPIEKGLLFRLSPRKNNPLGSSILRGAYLPWWRKKNLEAIESIGIERDLAGLPRMKVPAEIIDGTNDAAATNWKNVLVNVRQDEQAGILIPSDLWGDTDKPMFDFDLVSSAGTAKHDTSAVIARYSAHMAMAMMTDLMLMGHENVGSYALSVSKERVMGAALDAILDGIASVLNTHALPRVFALNGMDLRDLPRFVPGKVEQVDLEALGSFLLRVTQAGAGLFPNPELDRELSRVAGLPEPPEDEDVVPGREPPPVEEENGPDVEDEAVA